MPADRSAQEKRRLFSRGPPAQCVFSALRFAPRCLHLRVQSLSPQPLRRQRELAMSNVKYNTALIVGAGSGLSASLARALAKEGIKVALAARSADDLEPLAKETGAHTFACD